MKITQLELFKVLPRWLFLKVTTDEGLVGWGEPIGHADTVAAAMREVAAVVIGQDPGRIGDIWQHLKRSRFYRGGPVMMSAALTFRFLAHSVRI